MARGAQRSDIFSDVVLMGTAAADEWDYEASRRLSMSYTSSFWGFHVISWTDWGDVGTGHTDIVHRVQSKLGSMWKNRAGFFFFRPHRRGKCDVEMIDHKKIVQLADDKYGWHIFSTRAHNATRCLVQSVLLYSLEHDVHTFFFDTVTGIE